MKAKRALIFFFDVNHAYIMAEATQTLSLENDGIHDPGDQLWLGYSVIPRNLACCEFTVNLPSFDTTKSSGHYRDNCFVVDDLTKHPEFRLRNYVTEHPHGRYYAGVPITTPAGVNIGAYCVLDDKPRSGISDQELVFLRDMSQTVMTHLQTIRATSEREQNSRMVAGLGDFVRGTSNSLHKGDREHASQETQLPPLKSFGRNREASRNVQRSVPSALIANAERGSRQGHSDASGLKENIPAQHTARGSDKNDEYKHTYQRAAEKMCQSLQIDGVAILDLSVDVFGGLVKSREDQTSESSFTSESASDEGAGKETKPCPVLGCAENLSLNKSKLAPSAKTLTETFVRRLMHRNPRGKIWSFGEDLTLHSDDGFSTEGESADSDEHTRPPSPETKERKYARRVRRSDADTLQLAFPGARCIALHGIWDHARHRWSVAGLYWTYDPLRVLSPENEMQFVNAFCDIMVAEINRVEVLTADKSKSDFISSVSHELRSPLHGILGSVEVLLEEKLENTVATLVQQISTCGNSLLEIIDHLLDFANLKKHQVKRGAAKSSKIGRKFLPDTADIPESNLAALKTGIALDDLTEDAVSSSVYSFHYHHEGDVQTSVILDIERSESTDWICKLATGGFKRICINLVTNALKYTPLGWVQVTLRRRAKPGFRRRFDAVLTVADSGKGMSDEFQKNHLFEDFSQEDTLASGLGIGMHMVARIVNAMGGTIEVVSDQKGGGTVVTVTVPIENTPDLEEPSLVDGAAQKNAFAAVKVGVIEVKHITPISRDQRLLATAQAMAVASVEKNLEILGMKPEKCSLGRHAVQDLNVVFDVDLATYVRTLRSDTSLRDRTRRPAILVVCSSNPSARNLRRAWREDPMNAKVTAEFVALPCGLRELTRAIAYALQKIDRRDDSAVDAESSGSAREYPVTPDDRNLYEGLLTDRIKTSLPTRPPASSGYTGMVRPKNEVLASTMGGQAPLRQLSSSFQELSLLPDHRMEQPQDSPSATTCEQRPSEPPSMLPAKQPNPGRPVVLLVDDNSINLQLLVRFAKKQNYQYVTASDGKLALEAFENAHRNSSTPSSPDATKTAGLVGDAVPRVILMDINMPVMDGYESLQRIRAYEKKHHMSPSKAIAVTALGSDAARAEAFGSGFDLFCSKPLKLKDLAMLIE